jgi:drug/metabolite transporter (DMT)-like permease
MSNHPFAAMSSAASLILASAFWAVGAVISKSILSSVPAITFLIAQLVPSVLVLWSVALLTRVRLLPRHTLTQIALLGILNPGLSYTFSILGLKVTTASAASLLWVSEPALIVVLAWLLLAEKPSVRILAATASAACGVLLVSKFGTGVGASSDAWATA